MISKACFRLQFAECLALALRGVLWRFFVISKSECQFEVVGEVIANIAESGKVLELQVLRCGGNRVSEESRRQ